MNKYKVGDKFIIEIAEVCENVLSGIDVFETVTSEPLYRIKGFNSLVFDKNGLDKLEKLKKPFSVPYSESYEKGMTDTWDITKELCEMTYTECKKVFGNRNVDIIVNQFKPLEVKERIESFKKEKISVGDKVQKFNDSTRAIILDKKDLGDEYKNEWIVYTENGCVEYWHEYDIKKIDERVDLSKLF